MNKICSVFFTFANRNRARIKLIKEREITMQHKIEIRELNTVEAMLQNFHLVQQLTPSLSYEIYRKYLQEMIPHNYFQISASINDQTIGVSGYWIATKLYCGRYLEIDNFVVDKQYRSQKVGFALIKRLEEIAVVQKCDVIMLDAYLQNTEAHKFYENHKFKAKGYHFIKKVSPHENNHECLR